MFLEIGFYCSMEYGVTLCRWPAKQTIPLSVLARHQTKGFGLEISAGPEVEGDARREWGSKWQFAKS